MSTLWTTILLVAAVSIGIKAAGPVLRGGRPLPAWTTGVIAVLAPALLTGLVLTDVAGPAWSAFDWRLCGGLGVAAAAYLMRAPMLPAIAAGVVATAVLRLVA